MQYYNTDKFLVGHLLSKTTFVKKEIILTFSPTVSEDSVGNSAAGVSSLKSRLKKRKAASSVSAVHSAAKAALIPRSQDGEGIFIPQIK